MSTREYSKFSLQLNTDYYYGSVLYGVYPNPIHLCTIHLPTWHHIWSQPTPSPSPPSFALGTSWYSPSRPAPPASPSPSRSPLPLAAGVPSGCAVLRNYLVGRQRILYPGPIILTSADLYSSLYLCQISPAVATQL